MGKNERIAAHVYAALSALAVGDRVPADVYVLDYEDGTVPRWCVAAITPTAADGYVLTVEDEGQQATLWDGAVRVGILTFPTKTVRTRPFMGETWPGQACDMVQQAAWWQSKRSRAA